MEQFTVVKRDWMRHAHTLRTSLAAGSDPQHEELRCCKYPVRASFVIEAVFLLEISTNKPAENQYGTGTSRELVDGVSETLYWAVHPREMLLETFLRTGAGVDLPL